MEISTDTSVPKPQKVRDVKCFVCSGDSPKYHCPRCGVHYCSLVCYRDSKHESCSEAFYKEQVMEELKNMKGSKEDKMKMLKMLQKQQQNESCDDNLSQRLAGIHMDDHEGLWENLSEEEQHLFNERLRTGNVDFLITWKPWWKRGSRTEKLPKLFQDFETCQQLLNGKPPHFSLKFNCCEIILTYVAALRLFNGDLYDSPFEVCNLIHQLSNVLSEDRNYSDVETVFVFFIQNHQELAGLSEKHLDECFKDLSYFIESSRMIMLHALCDFHKKMKKLRKLVSLKKDDPKTELICKLYKNIKKLYFLSCFCNENEKLVRESGKELLKLYKVKQKDRLDFNEHAQDIEKHKHHLKPKVAGHKNDGSNVLIEEL